MARRLRANVVARPLRLALYCIVLSALGCAQQPKRPPAQFEQSEWRYAGKPGQLLKTEHYEIYTTLQDRVLLETIPDVVEAAYAHYESLVPPVRPPEERMKIYLFATRAEWTNFTKRFAGPRAKVFLQVRNGGYSENGISVIQYVAHQTTFPILAHEGFHQYLYHRVNPNVPAWLNEGLATLCEGQRWNGPRIEAFEPDYNPIRANDLSEALLAGKLHSLRTLLETHAGKVVQGTSRSVSTYYAQVWALMLFLREGASGKYASDFQRLVAALADANLERYAQASYVWSEGADYNFGEALFRNFIAEDLDQAELDYTAFLRQKFLREKPPTTTGTD
jgi:hypothetical protein